MQDWAQDTDDQLDLADITERIERSIKAIGDGILTTTQGGAGHLALVPHSVITDLQAARAAIKGLANE